MPQAGFKPTGVGVTSFQLNAKRALNLQATTAGFCNETLNTQERPSIFKWVGEF